MVVKMYTQVKRMIVMDYEELLSRSSKPYMRYERRMHAFGANIEQS